MARRVPKDKRAACIRIRLEEQISTPAIARRVGISNFSAYKILKNHPWAPRWTPPKGGKRATWSPDEVAIVKRLWPTAEPEEILAALPTRRWESIQRKACELDVRRPLPGTRKNKRFVHPACAYLRAVREKKRMTRPQVSKKCGYHINELLNWELGKTMPKLKHVTDWAAALGVEVLLQPVGRI